mmetsp:Transcript_7734/g.18018  ORF Transcript_7734/g.18018 Transcript_7734/m.18018 type:complete len:209 (+) Transcript_7734:1876-2502(+)
MFDRKGLCINRNIVASVPLGEVDDNHLLCVQSIWHEEVVRPSTVNVGFDRSTNNGTVLEGQPQPQSVRLDTLPKRLKPANCHIFTIRTCKAVPRHQVLLLVAVHCLHFQTRALLRQLVGLPQSRNWRWSILHRDSRAIRLYTHNLDNGGIVGHCQCMFFCRHCDHQDSLLVVSNLNRKRLQCRAFQRGPWRLRCNRGGGWIRTAAQEP